MRNETLEAFQDYIRTVEITIKTMLTQGVNTPMTSLANATGRLHQALGEEDVTDKQPEINLPTDNQWEDGYNK